MCLLSKEKEPFATFGNVQLWIAYIEHLKKSKSVNLANMAGKPIVPIDPIHYGPIILIHIHQIHYQ